ncbi:MAG: hypothetical protein ACPGVV_06670 [Croceimicrobium sp.]
MKKARFFTKLMLTLVLLITFEGNLIAQEFQLIKIAESITIRYKPKSEMILRDSTFKAMKLNFAQYREAILLALEDSTLTEFKVCSKEMHLRIGDFAWMLLRELQKIPKDCSIRSFNTYRGMCFFPVGLLDHMEKHRLAVAADLRECVPME